MGEPLEVLESTYRVLDETKLDSQPSSFYPVQGRNDEESSPSKPLQIIEQTFKTINPKISEVSEVDKVSSRVGISKFHAPEFRSDQLSAALDLSKNSQKRLFRNPQPSLVPLSQFLSENTRFTPTSSSVASLIRPSASSNRKNDQSILKRYEHQPLQSSAGPEQSQNHQKHRFQNPQHSLIPVSQFVTNAPRVTPASSVASIIQSSALAMSNKHHNDREFVSYNVGQTSSARNTQPTSQIFSSSTAPSSTTPIFTSVSSQIQSNLENQQQSTFDPSKNWIKMSDSIPLHTNKDKKVTRKVIRYTGPLKDFPTNLEKFAIPNSNYKTYIYALPIRKASRKPPLTSLSNPSSKPQDPSQSDKLPFIPHQIVNPSINPAKPTVSIADKIKTGLLEGIDDESVKEMKETSKEPLYVSGLPSPVSIQDIPIVSHLAEKPDGPVIVRKPVTRKNILDDSLNKNERIKYIIYSDKSSKDDGNIHPTEEIKFDTENNNNSEELSYYDLLNKNIYSLLEHIHENIPMEDSDVSGNQAQLSSTSANVDKVVNFIETHEKEFTNGQKFPAGAIDDVSQMIVQFINERHALMKNQQGTGKHPSEDPSSVDFSMDDKNYDYHYVYYDEFGNEYLPEYVNLPGKNKIVSPSDEFTKAFLAKHTSKLSSMLTSILQSSNSEDGETETTEASANDETDTTTQIVDVHSNSPFNESISEALKASRIPSHSFRTNPKFNKNSVTSLIDSQRPSLETSAPLSERIKVSRRPINRASVSENKNKENSKSSELEGIIRDVSAVQTLPEVSPVMLTLLVCTFKNITCTDARVQHLRR